MSNETVNPLRAKKIITLGDKEYTANMSLDTIIRLETKLNMGLFAIAKTIAEGNFTMSNIITILTICIRSSGTDIKEGDVKLIVNELGIVKSLQVISELLQAVLNDGTEEEKKSE